MEPFSATPKIHPTVLGKVLARIKKAKSKPGLILQAINQQYETYQSLSDIAFREGAILS
jgi:hypothetical protein